MLTVRAMNAECQTQNSLTISYTFKYLAYYNGNNK